MTFLFYAAAAFVVLALLAALFVRASPARIADTLMMAGPAVLGVFGIGLMVIGRIGLGTMVLSGAAALFMRNRARRGVRRSPGKRSVVRTAALEMELDHDSGGLEGVVLAGSYEGKTLGALTFEQLLELGTELSADGESLQLLETYLDGRFPGWREDGDAQAGGGQRAAPASGPMSQEEAYKILGLEAGASAAEIRKAHRRLMQRLHPDLGGSSFLAARINEAKDVLLAGKH